MARVQPSYSKVESDVFLVLTRSSSHAVFANILKVSFVHFFLQLGLDDLPEQVEPAMLEDDDFLQKFHHALLEVTIRIFSR